MENLPEQFIQARSGQVRPVQARRILDTCIDAKIYFFVVFLLSVFSYVAHYDTRRRAPLSSRPSLGGPRSRHGDFSTQILGFITKDDRFPTFAHVNNGRWQCHHSHGSTILHQDVIPRSLTVSSESSIDYRTLVYCCRIATYRPRRKKGRIKRDAEKRHFITGEQKIDEKAGDVLRSDSYGDKNDLSTPSVTDRLLSTRNPPPPYSATVARVSLRDKLDAAAGSKSERKTQCHDTLATTLISRCWGTTGRNGPWIQRSPTHTQRESSNDKFHCQWLERVVFFCFGLLTLTFLIRLTSKLTTLISLGNDTRIETFFSHLPAILFSLFFSLPQTSKSNVTQVVKADNRTKVGQSQQLRERTPRLGYNVVSKSFLSRSLPIRATSFPLLEMERSSVGSIPPMTITFSQIQSNVTQTVKANNCAKVGQRQPLRERTPKLSRSMTLFQRASCPRSLPIRATPLPCQRWKNHPLVRSHQQPSLFR